nr:unnamed protein product [Callosobruchus chinensis]
MAGKLLPTREESYEKMPTTSNVELSTHQELKEACIRLKSEKAPGLDGIPPEAIKMIVETAPDFFLAMLNSLLKQQTFSECWKTARLILIPKTSKIEKQLHPCLDLYCEAVLTARVNDALEKIDTSVQQNLLQLAPHKMEGVVLRGLRQERKDVRFKIKDTVIILKKSVKYLGIIFDAESTFGEHIKHAARKPDAKTAILARIMPNISGLSSARRQLLYGIVQSTIAQLDKAERKPLLRVASAYRTVSNRTLQVVAGIAPIWLLAKERCRLHKENGIPSSAKRNAERLITLREWQDLWDETTQVAQWTKRVIPDIHSWVNCVHRQSEYYLTQALRGHGPFRQYRKRIGKIDSDECTHCGQIDTVEHMIFICKKWQHLGAEVESYLGLRLTPDNIGSTMISSHWKWTAIHNMLKNLLKTKEREERSAT